MKLLKDFLGFMVGLVLMMSFVFYLIIRSVISPGNVGCDTVAALEGWSRCETVSNSIWATHGCSSGDTHSYRVRGRRGSRRVEALVCCSKPTSGCSVDTTEVYR